MPAASRPAWAYMRSGLSWSLVDVGQDHGADLQGAAVERALVGEELQHVGAEAADGAFLDGDQHLVVAGEPQDQLLVEGLGEAGIGDRGREAARFQLLGRLQGFRKARAERQDRDAAALA